MPQDRKTDILIGIFVMALVAANLLGSKVTTLFGVSVSVGIFAFPITFLITDAIAEVHGKKKAKNTVYAGLTALVFLLGLTALSVALPSNERFAYPEEYGKIFGASGRIIIASLVAFALSQTHDVWAFEFWKAKTSGKFLWMRNNLSTFVSQGIDTFIFMFIAFYKAFPKFDFSFTLHLALTYWGFKILFALIDTPFVYALVRWLKRSNNKAKEVRAIE